MAENKGDMKRVILGTLWLAMGVIAAVMMSCVSCAKKAVPMPVPAVSSAQDCAPDGSYHDRYENAWVIAKDDDEDLVQVQTVGEKTDLVLKVPRGKTSCFRVNWIVPVTLKDSQTAYVRGFQVRIIIQRQRKAAQ